MVTARARVSNASLRRVHFARTLALAATLLLLLPPLQAQARREAILRLREDVSTAMAHVSLNEKQIQKLDRCRQTLLVSAQAGRARGTGNKKDMDATVKDIEQAIPRRYLPARRSRDRIAGYSATAQPRTHPASTAPLALLFSRALLSLVPPCTHRFVIIFLNSAIA
jgi:hypothetical protein